MNDKIMKAIAGALRLLADEYKMALQSKYWSTMNEATTTEEAHLLSYTSLCL